MSADVYVNQEKLRIALTSKVTVANASATLIKYRKPSGERAEWSATSTDATTEGRIYYDVTSSNVIDESGGWHLWAHITDSDGKGAPGKVLVMPVGVEGEL